MLSVFSPTQLCVYAFLLSPFPFPAFNFFCPSVVRRTNIQRAELPWRCTQPSQRPNRGISLIGSVVLHHTPSNAHILAREQACSKNARTHSQIHTNACLHTYNDWLVFPYLMFQPMVYFHSSARELSPNACSKKTHSDDLGQIEALPSATDNFGLERR